MAGQYNGEHVHGEGETLASLGYEAIPQDWAKCPLVPDQGGPRPVEGVEVRDEHRGPLEWLSYMALRFAQQTLGRMPKSVRGCVESALVRLIGPLDRRHSRAAMDFVKTAYPDWTSSRQKALVRESWVHLFDLSLRSPYVARSLVHKPLGEVFDVRATPEARKLAEAGTPVIFASCHIGYFEVAGIALSTLGFAPVYAVAKAPRNDYLARHMQATREQQGGLLLPRREAMKSVPKVLRGGGSVMFMLDHRARKKSVYAPFFGRPAACERSASVLMRRLGVPVVLYACYGGQGGTPYELHLGPVIQPEEVAGMQPAELAAKLNGHFEKLIRYRPEEYLWLHDRFRNTPRDWADLEGAPGVDLTEPRKSGPRETGPRGNA